MTGGSAETDSGLDFLFCDLIEWKSAAGSAQLQYRFTANDFGNVKSSLSSSIKTSSKIKQYQVCKLQRHTDSFSVCKFPFFPICQFFFWVWGRVVKIVF